MKNRIEVYGRCQYSDLSDLKDAELWKAFKWQGTTNLRTVPAIVNGTEQPCRSCHFVKLKNTHCVCPGMLACCAHNRKDRVPVKFISADLNCINEDKYREIASKSDMQNRW